MTQAANLAALGTSAGTTGVLASAGMPTGSVLQVVSTTSNTQYSTNSSSWTSTNLSAVITPKFSTSKILIIVSAPDCQKYNDNALACGAFRVTRSGSTIYQFGAYTGYTGTSLAMYFATGGNYVDSPASTSALTYLVQISNTQNNGLLYFNASGTATVSTITLMEIAG
jgi:hypothetical protein